MTPESRLFRPSTSALAVCCAYIICNGIAGRTPFTMSNKTNALYSASGIFFESTCTPANNAPLTTVAAIIQVLCLTNAWSDFAAGIGGLSAMRAIIRSLTSVSRFGSRQGAKKTDQHPLRAFHCPQRYKLVGGM